MGRIDGLEVGRTGSIDWKRKDKIEERRTRLKRGRQD